MHIHELTPIPQCARVLQYTLGVKVIIILTYDIYLTLVYSISSGVSDGIPHRCCKMTNDVLSLIVQIR